MTKKDYIKAANIVNEVCKVHSYPADAVPLRAILANAFVRLFLEDNSRFDVARFCKACGM